MSQTTPTISEKILSILNNYSVCKEFIGGPEYMKFGEFDAHLLLCFGEHNITKRPIDDLSDKATHSIKQLLADFAEHITPEKKKPFAKHSDDMQNDVFLNAGFNACVDEITKRTKEYLS